MKFSLASLCIVALFAASGASAESLVDGDIEAGKAKATPCSACHGAAGVSLSPLWPNLAGQGAPYIVAQLKAFKGGLRKDPLMTPQAMPLSEADMADLAVYFESLPAAVQSVADVDAIDRAEATWRGGDPAEGVAACLACHGPTGKGNPAALYPALGGQHAAYIAKQLRDYAAGTRVSDGKTRIMREIAERMSQEDIEALAAYIQGLKHDAI
ncbi:MAG TPA: c-type cytochrome [Woeseiaceae bacterium]|nr:c-type cytochrome [Woeseiaceae bacterium]